MSNDATATDRRRQHAEASSGPWLFGYGSLIWKVDFEFIEQRRAQVAGWTRRFWQGSHDHRGTPAAPGRVLTLVEEPGARCHGIAYRISPAVFGHLDAREKNGYLRRTLPLAFDDGTRVDGLVYVADSRNPAWLGPAPTREIAGHIAGAAGPSGPNRDYLTELASALRALDIDDPHVFAIERALRMIDLGKAPVHP